MKLLTFGCSWTYGVGAHWKPGMSDQDFKAGAWTEESQQHSFRRKLSAMHNLENINYSEGASSNARNFRIARQLFSDPDTIAKLQCDTIVLWGITSTARSEMWSSNRNEYLNFKLDVSSVIQSDEADEFAEFTLNNIYDHEQEVIHLKEQMLLWNVLFEYYGIKNIWYDTFNTHDYAIDIPHLVRPDDLLTGMLNHQDVDFPPTGKFYHMSSWLDDDPRILHAKKAELLDPFTLHPTAKAHNIMADILDPYIKDRL